MAAPATHYVKSDDVHIAYQVLGNGPLDLVFVPGFVSHVEASWHVAERSAFFRRLASFSRLILFDTRGTGMSERGSQIFTLEQTHARRADYFGESRFRARGSVWRIRGRPVSAIRAPTLILHRIGDRWLEIEHARSLLWQQLRCLTGGVS